MIGVAAIVAQKLGEIATVVGGDIDVAVVVKICSGQAAASDGPDKVWTQRIGHFFELALAEVAKHQQRLFVRDFAVVQADVIEHRAIQLQDIRPAVIVVIKKFHRNPAQEDGFVADTGPIGGVVKRAVAVVVIQTIQFEIEVGDVNILPTVPIHIRRIDAHPRFVTAIFTGGEA